METGGATEAPIAARARGRNAMQISSGDLTRLFGLSWCRYDDGCSDYND